MSQDYSKSAWWLLDALSRLLEPAERDFVRGDLAESAATPAAALLDVLGLVVRRQAALWRGWRPWAGLVFVVLPFGLLLGMKTVALSGTYDLYLWIIDNRDFIDPSLLRSIGLQVAPGVAALVWHSLVLSLWSWCAGFALGVVSKRAIGLNGALFCMVSLAGQRWAAPDLHYYVAGAGFSKSLSTVMLPVILLLVLVLLPARWGWRFACRPTKAYPFRVTRARKFATPAV